MKPLFIAVVLKHDGSKPTSDRNAVTGHSREDVIGRALDLRDKWQVNGNGPYRIFVGTLHTEVKLHRAYETISLEEAAPLDV